MELKPIPASFPQLEPYRAELREKYGSTIYPINRYCEVFKVRQNLFAIFVPCTHMMGDNWVYLIDGPEKALCIDNGFGIGDLKGLCEMLTGKEVLCAVTHAHGDHAGGNPQWDVVYAHEACADIMEQHMENYEQWWKDFNHVGEPQHRHFYDDADIIPYKPYKIVHMKNHTCINLGGDYDVELIHFGGHTPGSCVFLDKKSRILFGGDTFFETKFHGSGLGCNIGLAGPGLLHPEYMGVRYYASQVAKFVGRVGEFDCIMPGHAWIDGTPQAVVDTHRAVQAILADPRCYDLEMKGPFGTRYAKFTETTDIMYDLREFE